MPALRSSTTVAPVGSFDVVPTPSPVTLPAPSGLAVGDLFLVFVWFAQGIGTTTLFPPNGFTKLTTEGVVANRLGAVYAQVVTDPAALASGVNLRATLSSTRVAAIGQAWTPDAGKAFDIAQVTASALEWNGASMTSDTFPAGITGDVVLGVSMTNKSASATVTTHSATGGTLLDQATALSAASGTVSDSTISVVQGGTGVSFNTPQANGQTYTVGMTQVDAAPEPPSTLTGTVWNGTAQVPATVRLWTGTQEVPVSRVLSLPHRSYSISQMEADIQAGRDVYWSHRGGSLNWPEMSMRAYTNSVWYGAKALEISIHWSSDGVPIMSHDATMTRTTTSSATIASTPASSLLGTPIDVPVTGGVTGRLEDVLSAYPNLVLVVDNKPQTNRSEFMDLLKTVPNWQDRIIIKIDGAVPLVIFQEAFEAGFKTCAYYYNNTANFETTLTSKMPFVTYPGLNYDASPALWSQMLSIMNARSASDGIFRAAWGHVLPGVTAKNTSKTNGAKIFQCADINIIPRINEV